MAQLVERLVRNEKASGSNPLISTKKTRRRFAVLLFLSIIVRTVEVFSGSCEEHPPLSRKNQKN